jgi:hypothetical protein
VLFLQFAVGGWAEPRDLLVFASSSLGKTALCRADTTKKRVAPSKIAGRAEISSAHKESRKSFDSRLLCQIGATGVPLNRR